MEWGQINGCGDDLLLMIFVVLKDLFGDVGGGKAVPAAAFKMGMQAVDRLFCKEPEARFIGNIQKQSVDRLEDKPVVVYILSQKKHFLLFKIGDQFFRNFPAAGEGHISLLARIISGNRCFPGNVFPYCISINVQIRPLRPKISYLLFINMICNMISLAIDLSICEEHEMKIL